jgi:hypothetical protein
MPQSRKIVCATKIFRNDNVVWTSIDDKVVILSIESGQYYDLDSISSRIGELLEKPLIVNELSDVLSIELTFNLKDARKKSWHW